jgi:hypothetical protein
VLREAISYGRVAGGLLSEPVSLRLQVERKTETLRRGWAAFPPWVFCTEAGTTLDESQVRKVFTKTLRASALLLHFSPADSEVAKW